MNVYTKKEFYDMLHERPGGSRPPAKRMKTKASGDYQMHLDIMDYRRGITTTPIYVHIQHKIFNIGYRDFGSEFGHWYFLWKHFVIDS